MESWLWTLAGGNRVRNYFRNGWASLLAWGRVLSYPMFCHFYCFIILFSYSKYQKLVYICVCVYIYIYIQFLSCTWEKLTITGSICATQSCGSNSLPRAAQPSTANNLTESWSVPRLQLHIKRVKYIHETLQHAHTCKYLTDKWQTLSIYKEQEICIQLPSWVRSSKIDMTSAFKWAYSTVAANFPRFDAADLLTIGISSWHNWLYIDLNSVFDVSGALGYAIWNSPHAETRAVNHSPAANLWTKKIAAWIGQNVQST